MVKVVVCGAAGGIGQPLSMLLKQNLPSGSVLALYDVVNVKGVAADLAHISTHVKVEAYLGDMKDASNVTARDQALANADIVVIPAGVPRKPGMTRDDLFNINAGIVRGLIEGIAKQCPKAFIALITNPVNSTVPVVAEVLKKAGCYDAKRVFGVSTLDVVRAQTFIGELKNIDPLSVKIDVVGGHSPETMIPLFSQVQGITFTDSEIRDITMKVKEAGTAIVTAKEGLGSATLSMAYAAARFTDSLIKALNGHTVREITYVDTKSLGVETPAPYFGIAVDIGKDGITKAHPLPKFNEYEAEQMKEAMTALEQNIATGVNFVNGK